MNGQFTKQGAIEEITRRRIEYLDPPPILRGSKRLRSSISAGD
jgi:hypothetical protein